MAATARERNSDRISRKTANCLVNMLAQAEVIGQLDSMRQALDTAFAQVPELSALPKPVHRIFMIVVIGLRNEMG